MLLCNNCHLKECIRTIILYNLEIILLRVIVYQLKIDTRKTDAYNYLSNVKLEQNILVIRIF